jgi:glycosyltransferase involved in cell wall biosynthesis
MPSISVVTICFNNLNDLIKTCQSVNAQQQPPFEHIIIDGSTNSAIKEYLETLPQPSWRRWINERDKGIADAFNKGILLATGDVVHLLNSGDVYYDNAVLQNVQEVLQQKEQATWFHGQLHMKRGGEWVIIGKPFDKTKVYRGMRGTLHPTMFVYKTLYTKYGLFDTSLKIAMDYDFLVRIAAEPFTYAAFPVVTFDPGGVSSNTYLASLKENKYCYEKYHGKSSRLFFWQLRLTFLHYLLHSPIGNFLYRLKKKLGLANA